MEIMNVKRTGEFNINITFKDDLKIEVEHPKYFESLILLIIKLLDTNFKYETAENAFELDSCVNFMFIIYKSTIYTENIHNKKELYVNYQESEAYGEVESLGFFDKSLRSASEAAYPDFYTYYTGAYSNLGVMYKIFQRFVKKMNLDFVSTKNETILEFIFIRNKLLIHPEDNMILGDNFEQGLLGMNNMDWNYLSENRQDSRCMYYYFYKGKQNSIDLAGNYLKYVEEILFQFLEILLNNGHNKINDTNFDMEKYFF
ncbi:MAG: hypothetical protein RR470_11865 [Vagococcus sp.]|uniref:hypothetical protein n=1 Tax=Vagococcus sp. TaxID=1933889 RepID=UPI002FCB971D